MNLRVSNKSSALVTTSFFLFSLASTASFSALVGCKSRDNNQASSEAVAIKNASGYNYYWFLSRENRVREFSSSGSQISSSTSNEETCLYKASSSSYTSNPGQLAALFKTSQPVTAIGKPAGYLRWFDLKDSVKSEARKTLSIKWPTSTDTRSVAEGIEKEVQALIAKIVEVGSARIDSTKVPFFDVYKRDKANQKICRGFLGLGKNAECEKNYPAQKSAFEGAFRSLQTRLNGLRVAGRFSDSTPQDLVKFYSERNTTFSYQPTDFQTVQEKKADEIHQNEISAYYNAIEVAAAPALRLISNAIANGDGLYESAKPSKNVTKYEDGSRTEVYTIEEDGGLTSAFEGTEQAGRMMEAAYLNEQIAMGALKPDGSNRCPSAASVQHFAVKFIAARDDFQAPPKEKPSWVNYTREVRLSPKSGKYNEAFKLVQVNGTRLNCAVPSGFTGDFRIVEFKDVSDSVILSPLKGVSTVCGFHSPGALFEVSWKDVSAYSVPAAESDVGTGSSATATFSTGDLVTVKSKAASTGVVLVKPNGKESCTVPANFNAQFKILEVLNNGTIRMTPTSGTSTSCGYSIPGAVFEIVLESYVLLKL